MYLVTVQFGGSSPHEWHLFEDRDNALEKAVDLGEGEVPNDLSEWEWHRGNQHGLSRWWYWYKNSEWPVNIVIRKLEPGDQE